VEGFVHHFTLLILIGPPGIQKSVSLRKAVGESACWLEGNVTAFRMYCELFQHRDQLVVIDDVDSLYGDRNGVRLLKCLCQTDARKVVAWHSSASSLEKDGIPQKFSTASRVAIIANDWRTLNENVLAVEDRGHVVFFEPNSHEIHYRTSDWFWDQEIFDFIGERLNLIEQPSMRLYIKAWELKLAEMDWRGYLLSRFLTGPALLVATLKADTSFTREADRVEVFIAKGGGTRSTYFYHAARLPEVGRAPRIRLRNRPPRRPGQSASWIDEFQQRLKRFGMG
jgi:hypothetical protein